jgi:hypothetical protein
MEKEKPVDIVLVVQDITIDHGIQITSEKKDD